LQDIELPGISQELSGGAKPGETILAVTSASSGIWGALRPGTIMLRADEVIE